VGQSVQDAVRLKTTPKFTTESVAKELVKICQYLMKLTQNLIAYFFGPPGFIKLVSK